MFLLIDPNYYIKISNTKMYLTLEIYKGVFVYKKYRTKLIKERIELNWKSIVTFRNNIHKSTQYYFIDMNYRNGCGWINFNGIFALYRINVAKYVRCENNNL